MKVSEVTRAMVGGLRNPACIIDMGGYGESRDPEDEYGNHYPERLCFGCAATNTLAKLAGIEQYTPDQIDDRISIVYRLPKTLREVVEDCDTNLECFESAIDDLRRGWRGSDAEGSMFLIENMGLDELDQLFPASNIDVAVVKNVFLERPLPRLDNDYTEAELRAYEAFAVRLEAVGQ